MLTYQQLYNHILSEADSVKKGVTDTVAKGVAKGVNERVSAYESAFDAKLASAPKTRDVAAIEGTLDLHHEVGLSQS